MLDRETREYIKREISRRMFDSIPKDSLGRRINLEPDRILSGESISTPGNWMPYLSSKRYGKTIDSRWW